MNIPVKAYWNLLINYLKSQWLRVLLLSILLFGGIGLQLVNPQIMRRFIDAATGMADVQLDAAQRTIRLRNTALLFMGFAVHATDRDGWRDLPQRCGWLDLYQCLAL